MPAKEKPRSAGVQRFVRIAAGLPANTPLGVPLLPRVMGSTCASLPVGLWAVPAALYLLRLARVLSENSYVSEPSEVD